MTRKYSTSLLVAFMGFISCNNESQSNAQSSAAVDTVVPAAVKAPVADTAIIGCYNWILNKDTATLQLQVKGENITGTLVYDFFEKDRNDGTVQAELNNNILTGWYLFRSEGIMSVRQVAWKVSKNALLPGTGEMIQRNDTLLFKRIDNLEFDSIHAFVKIPCTM